MDTDQRRGATVVNLGDGDNLTPRDLLRVQRLARELRLTDQILSVDLDTVVVQSSGPAPAWTTLEGDKVSFAYAAMPKPKHRSDIAVWLGTNAHELGHVLFSPRKHSTLMFRVIESDRAFLPGIAMMHNIVEDQRQERLILTRFAPWTGYLTAALGYHLSADDNTAWLLMAGRTWLPDSVRSVAKARMVAHRGQRDTDAVTRIVGEYQRLTDPGETDSDEAWTLLQELHAMFEDEQPHGGGCGGGVMVAGDPDTDADGTGGPATADEADPDATGDGAGDGDGDSTDGDGDDDGDAKGNKDGEQDGKETEGTGGTGAGTDPGKPFDRDATKRQLRDAAGRQIDDDDAAKEDLDAISEALDYGRVGENAEGEDAVGRNGEVTAEARSLHREVSDALLDLKDEREAGWNKRTDSGRLNVRRMLSGHADADEMFDRYDPGMMDASEMEVVLLLDVSSSMAGQMHALGEATWAIRHAVDDIEGTITVLTFDSGPHRVLAERGARPDDRMFVPQSLGGTEPTSAIREAHRLLAGADAKNRLFVILTDGAWSGLSGDRTIAELNRTGVTTVIAFLGGAPPWGVDLHNCQYGAEIGDPLELARLFRRIATERIGSWQ